MSWAGAVGQALSSGYADVGPARVDFRVRTDVPTFSANHDSPCADPACVELILRGDEVRWDGGRVVHAGCSSLGEREVEAGEVCGRCFTELAVNGSCACDE